MSGTNNPNGDAQYDRIDTRYEFFPSVREGFRPTRPYRGGTLDGRSVMGVDLTVEGRPKGEDEFEPADRDPTVDLRMYGPGDVTGIDHRQVLRTAPEPDTDTFPPNYFPHIEFDRPDFPWLFSPERANSEEAGRVRPWCCLVVVERDHDDVETDAGGRGPLPTLEAPVDQLPPIEEVWAWAHVQVVGILSDSELDQVFTGSTPQAVSRLICPRRLEENTGYVAAVVPTFAPGVRVGLGEEPYDGDEDDPTIEPAWNADSGDTVRLPVYYQWRFVAGDGGDFEALARKLEPTNLAADHEVGVREIDLSDPGLAPLADGDGQIGEIGGALQAPGLELTRYPSIGPDGDEDKRLALREVLNDPAGAVGEETEYPVVGPPIYGRWYVPAGSATPGDPEPTGSPDPADVPVEGSDFFESWLHELNLEPGFRVAAGYGTEVIQENQEPLMEEAWQRFGDLEGANERLGRAQVGKLASDRLSERVDALADVDLVGFASRIQPPGRIEARIASEGRITDDGFLEDTTLDDEAENRLFVEGIEELAVSGDLTSTWDVDPDSLTTDGGRTGTNDDASKARFEALASPTFQRLTRRGGKLDRPSNAEKAGDGSDGGDKSNRETEGEDSSDRIDDKRGDDDASHGGDRTPDLAGAQPFTDLVTGSTSSSGTEVSSRFGRNVQIRAEDLKTVLQDAEEDSEGGDEREGGAGEGPTGDADTDTGEPTAVDESDELDSYDKILHPTIENLGPLIDDLLPEIENLQPVIDDLQPEIEDEDSEQTFDPADRVATIAAKLRNGQGSMPGALDGGAWSEHRTAVRLGTELTDRKTPLGRIMAAPEFERPMYTDLRDVDQSYLLPGVEDIPRESIGALETNPAFVEAVMCGLNHEMARELLWNRYPTDRRGTYFRRFWDYADDDRLDIEKIHKWGPDNLGENDPGGSGERQVVLVVRGDLLEAYPNTRIYAVKAVKEDRSDPDSDETDWDRVPLLEGKRKEALAERADDSKANETLPEYDQTHLESWEPEEPIFSGTVDPDITFFGFEFTAEDAAGETIAEDPTDENLGWFFVLEEPVGETHFGFDVATASDYGSVPWGVRDENGETVLMGEDAMGAGDPKGWDGISWGHLVDDENALEAKEHVSVTGDRPAGGDGQPWAVVEGEEWNESNDATWDLDDEAEWGRNSAHMARISWQLPMRVCVHGDDILPEMDGDDGAENSLTGWTSDRVTLDDVADPIGGDQL